MTRFLDWVWKHRALFGYIGIVLVAVLALEIHNGATESRLNGIDHRSCKQRRALAANQVFVLHALRDLQLIEIHGEEAKQHARFRESVIADIREAERRLETLNPIQDC